MPVPRTRRPDRPAGTPAVAPAALAPPLLPPPPATSLPGHLASALGSVIWDVLLWADRRERRRGAPGAARRQGPESARQDSPFGGAR